MQHDKLHVSGRGSRTIRILSCSALNCATKDLDNKLAITGRVFRKVEWHLPFTREAHTVATQLRQLVINLHKPK